MYDSLEKNLTVVTPEQVQLQFQTAGIGSRAMAQLFDTLMLILLNTGIFFALYGLASLADGEVESSTGSDYAVAIFIIFWLLVNVGYFICTEYFMGGQTPGKRVFGLRVIQDNGQSATFLAVIIRNFFRIIDLLPTMYFLGVVVMLFSKKDKRIGDMVAGTIVIVEQHRAQLKRRKVMDKVIARWRDRMPELEIGEVGRQGINAQDWLMLSSWAERLPIMSNQKLDELGKPIAAYLANKLQHPQELTVQTQAYLIAIYEVLREDWEV
jgi:uncharacterized RDD family membrane protein YckC